MKFSAVILAGGKSQRMGRDKALLSFEGKPLLARQIQLVRDLGAAEIFISGRAGVDYGPFDCPVLVDRFEGAGPLAGIAGGLEAATTSLLLVLAVDMPRMGLPQLQSILARCCEENRGSIPQVNGAIEPLAAVYPRNSLNLAVEFLENKRYAARHFAERCVQLNLATFVELPEQLAMCFENWNTPEDVSGIGG